MHDEAAHHDVERLVAERQGLGARDLEPVPAVAPIDPSRIVELPKAYAYARKNDLPLPPGQGLTSTAFDRTTPRGFYGICGYRICGSRVVRIDMLERLSDLIRVRVAWRKTDGGEAEPSGATGDGGFRAVATHSASAVWAAALDGRLLPEDRSSVTGRDTEADTDARGHLFAAIRRQSRRVARRRLDCLRRHCQRPGIG